MWFLNLIVKTLSSTNERCFWTEIQRTFSGWIYAYVGQNMLAYFQLWHTPVSVCLSFVSSSNPGLSSMVPCHPSLLQGCKEKLWTYSVLQASNWLPTRFRRRREPVWKRHICQLAQAVCIINLRFRRNFLEETNDFMKQYHYKNMAGPLWKVMEGFL